MVKFKVTAQVVNRGGKRYIAKDWVIEVWNEDKEYFEGFTKVEDKKVTPNKIKNENIK